SGLEVGAHAPAEGVLAEPAFEHVDDGGTLLVGDAVESAEDVAARIDRLADAARRGQRILVDRLRALVDPPRAMLVVGLPLLDDLLGDPRGERLVQPDVVPPRGRNEVAEPLVRDLVRADTRCHAPEARAVRAWPGEQDVRTVSDHPRVLHRETDGEG